MSDRSTTEEFVDNAIKIHGELYDYSLVDYKSSIDKVMIKCRRCNKIFEQRPNGHLNGKGCINCSGTEVSTTSEFIIKAKEIHNNDYNYLLVNYINARTKVKILCNNCNAAFEQTPHEHLKGSGCNRCFGKFKYSNDEFTSKACKIHDGRYSYTKVDYKNYRTKVIIICDKHGEFEQSPASHLNGRGCPKCNCRVSKPENNFLNYIGIKKRQHRIHGLVVDGYDEITNTIYEFLGDYWHGNPEKFKLTEVNTSVNVTYNQLYIDTFDRFKKLKDKNYNIKYIWENDWNKFICGHDKEPNIISY